MTLCALACIVQSPLAELLDAGRDADARVRRDAYAALGRSLDARRSVTPLPDLDVGGSYTTYEWQALPDDALAFGFLTREGPLEEIGSFLEDPVAENRILALMVLAKLQRVTPNGLRLVRAACADEHPGVRLWAEHVRDRIEPPRWLVLRRLRATLLSRESTPGQPERSLDELVRAMTEGEVYSPRDDGILSALPEEPDRQYAAARELVRRHLPDLLERVGLGDAAAERTLDTAQVVVERHIRVLLFVTTNEFPPGRAPELLVDMGPAAVPYVAAAFLVSTWNFKGGVETSVRDMLAPVLARSGPPALPALCFGLENPQDLAPANALDLGRLGSDAAPALPGLFASWRDPSQVWIVEPVCAALGEVAIPYLVAALGDEHPISRTRACRGLAVLGADGAAAGDVLDALAGRLHDEEATVRRAAAEALLDLAPEDRPDLRRAAETERARHDGRR